MMDAATFVQAVEASAQPNVLAFLWNLLPSEDRIFLIETYSAAASHTLTLDAERLKHAVNLCLDMVG